MYQTDLVNQPVVKASSYSRLSSSDCKTSSSKAVQLLPVSFVPGPYDVICARGKKAMKHPGNILFHKLIEDSVSEYAVAKGKVEKTLIVSDIVETIRRNSPRGGFVRCDAGQWVEVGDSVARERIGQSFRDLLSKKYRSSSDSKKCKRKANNEKMLDDIDEVIRSNEYIRMKMDGLQQLLHSSDAQTSEAFLLKQMTFTNQDVLFYLKHLSSTDRHQTG